MRKLIRRIVVLVVLLVAIAFALPFVIPAEQFKAPIIAKIEEITGRKIRIDGKIQLGFFPNLSVHIEKAAIGNPAGFDNKTAFVSLDEAIIDVGTLSILKGVPEVHQLSLKGAQIHLQVNSSGKANWEFTSSPTAPNAEKSVSNRGGPAVPLPRNLVLSDLSLKDSNVSYTNSFDGTRWQVGKINASVSLNGIESPFSVKGEGEWNKQLIRIDGKLSTLSSFFNDQKTGLDADIKMPLASMKLKGAIMGRAFQGNGNVEIGSLKTFLAWINPESPAPEFPQALSIESNIECAPQACNFTKGNLVFGGLRATGNLKASIEREKPRVELVLEAGVVNLNEFFPDSKKQASDFSLISSAIAQSAGHWDAKAFDFSGLHKLNAIVNLKAEGVLFRNFKVGTTTLNAKLERGRFGVDILDASLYEGKGNISITVDGGQAVPTLESHIVVNNIQAKPLLTDSANVTWLSGKAAAKIDVFSAGNSVRDMVSNLSGNGNINVRDGDLQGVNIVDMVRNVQSAFAPAGTQRTEFSSLTGNFVIKQGIVSNQDLLLTSTSMRVLGNGEVNLPLYTVSYRLTPQIASKDAEGNVKEGFAVPVLVSGSLDNPRYAPDLQAVAKEALKDPEQLKKTLRNTRESLQEQFKDPKAAIKDIKGLLKGL